MNAEDIIDMASVDAVKQMYSDNEADWDDINIFGIRDETLQDKDSFNDIIGICDGEQVKIYQATTDPGAWFTKNPLTAAGFTGCAHLCEGFHKGSWMVGIHAIKTDFAHEALVQIGGTVKIWRDLHNDYTQETDDPIQVGYFGIDIHRAGLDDPQKIGRYSAGCQVVRNHEEFLEFMSIVKSAKNWQKKRYNYLLINKKSLNLGETKE